MTLRAFHKCDAQKRRDIADKYSSSFHTDLSADVKTISWKAGFIVDTLLMDRSLSHAGRYLAYCLQDGVWKHNMAVVEILIGHSTDEVTKIEEEYLTVTGRTVISDLETEYDDEIVRDILIERLSLKVLSILNLLISFVDIIIPTFLKLLISFVDIIPTFLKLLISFVDIISTFLNLLISCIDIIPTFLNLLNTFEDIFPNF